MNNLEKEIDEGLKELITKYRKRKTMSTEKTKTEKEPTKDEVIEKLQTELVDLKDLYDNAIIENKALVKERNELKTELIIKHDLLLESNKEHDEDVDGFREDLIEAEKSAAVAEALHGQLQDQMETYVDLIEQLINK